MLNSPLVGVVTVPRTIYQMVIDNTNRREIVDSRRLKVNYRHFEHVGSIIPFSNIWMRGEIC